MLRILEHVKKYDWHYGLLLVASCALIAGVWLATSYRLGEPSPAERQRIAKRHESARQQATARPKGAETPISQPIVIDYRLPIAENGLAPVVIRVDTQQPIVFLTIDDGAYKDPSVIAALKKYHIKASLFLSKLFISSNPEFFAQLTTQGSYIEDHTVSHDLRMVKNMNYDQQKAEICGMADYEQQTYGRRPVLYRPPGGSYNDTMRRAAYDCGMKALVTWMVTVNNGSLQYQIGDHLRPGDIVLMHFRPTFVADLEAFIAAAKASGLRMALLEDAKET
jgi:peptidoglycan/xylan/chitin deacetylase (PgdA/CDA1 family)